MTIQERMVARSEREKDLLKYGRSQERERIIKLLKKEAEHHKQISESISMDEYMSESDSESEWWASVVLDKFADALIKGEK